MVVGRLRRHQHAHGLLFFVAKTPKLTLIFFFERYLDLIVYSVHVYIIHTLLKKLCVEFLSTQSTTTFELILRVSRVRVFQYV